MSIGVKICGLRTKETVRAAVNGGAQFLGFVFTPSHREVAPDVAAQLCQIVPAAIHRVGLFVDPTDEALDAVLNSVPLTHLQLHGRETPARVAALRARTGLPVIKALPIATDTDFLPVPSYEEVADYLLFDTKIGPVPTGGTGKSFDWSLLQGRSLTKPWLLAGGLHIDNVQAAITISGARLVDLSSGVETDGHKDPAKITRFLAFAAQIEAL